MRVGEVVNADQHFKQAERIGQVCAAVIVRTPRCLRWLLFPMAFTCVVIEEAHRAAGMRKRGAS
jgi:cyanophycinase-like exopeptidase